MILICAPCGINNPGPISQSGFRSTPVAITKTFLSTDSNNAGTARTYLFPIAFTDLCER